MMHVTLSLALLAAAPVAFAARPACEGVPTLMDKGANGDGSTLAWMRSTCGDVIAEELVIHERGGRRTTILSVEGGAQQLVFSDLNQDGELEVDVVAGCGTVNCEGTIYAIDRRSLKARKILHYFGLSPDKVGEYFVSMQRISGAGEYVFTGYRIFDYKQLVVAKAPSFTLHTFYDPKTLNTLCDISLPLIQRHSNLVKALVEKACLPGALVRMGRRQYV